MASKLAGPKYIELSKGETTIFAELMVLKILFLLLHPINDSIVIT